MESPRGGQSEGARGALRPRDARRRSAFIVLTSTMCGGRKQAGGGLWPISRRVFRIHRPEDEAASRSADLLDCLRIRKSDCTQGSKVIGSFYEGVISGSADQGSEVKDAGLAPACLSSVCRLFVSLNSHLCLQKPPAERRLALTFPRFLPFHVHPAPPHSHIPDLPELQFPAFPGVNPAHEVILEEVNLSRRPRLYTSRLRRRRREIGRSLHHRWETREKSKKNNC